MSETVLPVFTKEMKATHTILVPNMLPFHFALLRSAAATKPKFYRTPAAALLKQG